jgi:hydroxymethylglutaryl-CoA synthase
MAVTKSSFDKKVKPSLKCAKELGNMYCGSLYGGLVALVSTIPSEQLVSEEETTVDN